MNSITLHAGDNRASLAAMIARGELVDSVVTDPPYGLVSTTKRFGAEKAAPAKFGSDGAFARASSGFMGSKWDATGIERDPEFWSLLFQVLKPGGYVLAFSSPRTGHWQACAIEMAGFIMHPFFGWVYGSGFPKAHNASKAIDRELGTSGVIVPIGEPVKRMIPGNQQHVSGDWIKTDDREYQPGTYVPGSDDAAQWEGWAYGAQSMKPALEPIYVGQKPFAEKNGALNLLKHGVGAMNIDGCRVEATGEGRNREGEVSQQRRYTEAGSTNFAATPGPRGGSPAGRHPANLLHDGSDNVVAMFPAKAGAHAPVTGVEPSGKTGNVYGQFTARTPSDRTGDLGSAARFFNSFPTSGESEYENGTQREQALECDPLFYHAKANKTDRSGSKHPTVKPIALMRWLCRLVTPPGGTVLDPFGGSGTTAAAARAENFDCILMEAEPQFIADIKRRFDLADDDFADLMPDDFAALIA
ncbi:site-specific DNA-methyltransferase [Sphingomonas sp. RB3P16]|uniref:site-specific DNA-methyltransferase n=1 Tax=Parasphingomonas frigoris TaxID=3096163 RepID=UPI002FC85909